MSLHNNANCVNNISKRKASYLELLHLGSRYFLCFKKYYTWNQISLGTQKV